MVKCPGTVLIPIDPKGEGRRFSCSLEGESSVGWAASTGPVTSSGGLQSAGRTQGNGYLAMAFLSPSIF